MVKKYLIVVIALAGLMDASFLTYEHFAHFIPPCSANILFADCGKVLNSSYATIFGIPLAALGIVHYSLILLLSMLIYLRRSTMAKYALVLEASMGFVASVVLVFLQLAIIKAICLYCMASALFSTLLFILALIVYKHERKRMVLFKLHIIYRYLLKPLFFLINPEIVHNLMVGIGERCGSNGFIKGIVRFLLYQEDLMIEQHIAGIDFKFPVGLAAGFDYEARLTNTLSAWGFGFQTVGTITNSSYQGNPKPMLGRLPKSKSLMVNKGFKNLGASSTITKLKKKTFQIPVGISIGRTNSLELNTQKESITDIIEAFKKFEKADIKNSYYELNISCPNLYGDVSFYPPKNLEELLLAVDTLKLKKPLFIKMPIEKSDQEVLAMLGVIVKHSPVGVIIGNLQKDRTNKALVKSEVAQFQTGNFSGKPTFERSNELIKLTYQHYGKKLVIIGCGGIFNAQDAYTKITLGASLVQLITGMIYEGPTLLMEINLGLADLLKKNGFSHLSEAIGVSSKRSRV